jgi:proline iminopeptidase
MLYPALEPKETGYLPVGAGHEIYFEVCGNPAGKPALFLHGGPGGACYADHRRLFDPQRYHIVLFDQRGCGRSRFEDRLRDNTTQYLVQDIEALREKLGFTEWHVVLGGSWGATLGLTYALTHRARVKALILRGVFSGRRSEIDWLYRFGASQLFPQQWEAFLGGLNEDERHDPLRFYHQRLMSPDEATRLKAARSWCAWEGSLLTLLPRGPYASSDKHVMGLAQIETHYFVNHCFLEDGELLRRAPELNGITGVIIQGRYDVVTPATTAHELQKQWATSRLEIVPDAGHATNEPGTIRKIIEATDQLSV